MPTSYPPLDEGGGGAVPDPLTITTVNVTTLAVSGQVTPPLNIGGAGISGVSLYVNSTGTTDPRGVMSAQHNTGVDGARFSLQKSRGTEAAPTIIVTGDAIGKLFARGYDGANYLAMASIEFLSTGTIAATRVPTTILLRTATNATPSVLTTALTLGSDQSATFAGTITVPFLQFGTGAATGNILMDSVVTSTGHVQLRTSNTNAGTGARTSFVALNGGSSSTSLTMGVLGTGFTTAGLTIQDAGVLIAGTGLAGGLAVGTEMSAPLVLGTNNTARITLSGDGTSLTLAAATNLLVGATAVGTNGVTVLAIKNGTAPSTAPTDTLQIFSEDVSAGNAVLSVFQEMAPYAGVGVASTTKVPVRFNGTTLYLLATTVA